MPMSNRMKKKSGPHKSSIMLFGHMRDFGGSDFCDWEHMEGGVKNGAEKKWPSKVFNYVVRAHAKVSPR